MFSGSTSRGSTGVYVVATDGAGLRRLTDTGEDGRPAWSPTGRAVAVVRWSLAGCKRPRRDCARIWAVTLESDGARPLTPTTHRSEDPAWSPDGTEIAFDRWRDDANPYAEGTDIYVMLSNGSGEKRLTHRADNTDPEWSPDGKEIAFTSDLAGNFDIYVMDVDGRHVRRLTRSSLPEMSPAWSPDGREIAYEAPAGVFVMKADGTHGRLVTGALPGASEPSWSPDGKQLVVTTNTGSGTQLYLISADGRTPEWLDTGKVKQPGNPIWVGAPAS